MSGFVRYTNLTYPSLASSFSAKWKWTVGISTSDRYLPIRCKGMHFYNDALCNVLPTSKSTANVCDEFCVLCG